ncbi:hypothetical protein V491_01011 [Pseudogymnoascus sp. VKM F-3775]|nr:hypothetical protein V491_01011 [Pseudogymnoascus sp. VKM F-3775]
MSAATEMLTITELSAFTKAPFVAAQRGSLAIENLASVPAPDSSNSVSPVTATAATVVYGIHRLAPLHVIEQIVHSWFDQIHSVAPFLHRRAFLTRLGSIEATQDGMFAALVVSLCAATIASLRRKSSQDHGTLCFTTMSEAVIGIKYLIHYEMPNMTTVSQELLKRLYWLLFAAGCSADLKGFPYVGLLTPQDNISALTPLELSDDELDPNQNPDPYGPWHGNDRSYVPGLNYLSRLFLLWNQSQQESPPSIAGLQHYMNLIKRALDYLPPELIWRGGLSRPPQSNFGTSVQMANLYITQLHIQSNLLEQIIHLVGSSAVQETTLDLITDRKSIVEDLLEILHYMPQETLEANGSSLIPKIRDIGTALFDDIRTGREGQSLSKRASDNLKRLLTKLENLDAQSQFYLEMQPLSAIT